MLFSEPDWPETVNTYKSITLVANLTNANSFNQLTKSGGKPPPEDLLWLWNNMGIMFGCQIIHTDTELFSGSVSG